MYWLDLKQAEDPQQETLQAFPHRIFPGVPVKAPKETPSLNVSAKPTPLA
jgi:hypothetical protein